MSTAHDNARVIDRLAREHERSAQVRATARQALRNSGSAADRKYLTMAERGYGVPHLIAAGCDPDIARRIVIGRTG